MPLFAGLFAFAALIGVLGQLVLKRQPERPKEPETESVAVLLSRPFADRNFRRMLLFACWWMLAVGVGAPFWQPFMIQHLAMSLVEIQVYATISVISSLVSLGLWGRFIDRFGNKSAMVLAILMGGVNPLPWLFVGPERYGIIFLEAGFSGAMWAGSGLVGMNFVLAVAPEGRRQIYSGLYGAFSGFAMMLTMILSGAFLPPALTLRGWTLSPEQVLFGATALLRWTALIPLLWVHEAELPSTVETLLTLRQFAKVRIAYLAERIIRRR
jgi:MFS family permease